MVKTIIFDLGGVIMTIDNDEALRRFQELGLKDAAKHLDPYCQNGIFGDLEEGKLDAEEFRIRLGRLCGHAVSQEEVGHAWLGYRKEVPQRNLDFLTQLRTEGYRVVLLSNTNPYMMRWADSNDFDGQGHPIGYYFDAMYRSYEVKLMKPDENFFRYVLRKEQVLPEETLFVDDGPRNVAAASELAIHTYCPQNGEDWTQELKKHLQ